MCSTLFLLPTVSSHPSEARSSTRFWRAAPGSAGLVRLPEFSNPGRTRTFSGVLGSGWDSRASAPSLSTTLSSTIPACMASRTWTRPDSRSETCACQPRKWGVPGKVGPILQFLTNSRACLTVPEAVNAYDSGTFGRKEICCE